MKPSKRRARIGLAVGTDGITAVARRADTEHVIAVVVEGDVATALRPALAELCSQLDTLFGVELAGARVDIALMPPLASTRIVQLPPLRPNEAAAVIARDAARYFLDVPVPRLIAVDPTKRAAGTPLLAAAAGAKLVEAVCDAVTATGWRCGSITSADAAWLAAASGADAVIAVDGDTTHIGRVENGTVTALRRVPSDDFSGIIAAAGDPGAVRLLTSAALGQRLADAFTDAGWTSHVSQADGRAPAARMAAARSAERAALVLTPATVLAERRDRQGSLAIRLAIAAIALFMLSAAVELWGTSRELDQLRGRRAEIRAQVEPLLAMRDSLDRLSLHSVDVENVARATPYWTAALFDLAMLLPHDAYITRLHASGDTIIVDGEGVGAGAALQALRGSSALRDAQLLGTVERELADGSTTVERFRLRAMLAADGTVRP